MEPNGLSSAEHTAPPRLSGGRRLLALLAAALLAVGAVHQATSGETWRRVLVVCLAAAAISAVVVAIRGRPTRLYP